MKTFVFAVLVLIVSVVNGQSQKGDYCLVTKVVFKNGKMVDSHVVTKTFYNKELKPTRTIGYGKNGSKDIESKYEYNDNRLVKVIRTSKKYGNEVTECIYDEQGNEVEVNKYQKGKVWSSTKKEYLDSKLIKRLDFMGRENLQLTGQAFMFYDDKGNNVRQIHMDAKGDTMAIEACNYDQKNVTRCATYSQGKIGANTEVYRDENGKRLKMLLYQGDQVSPDNLQTLVFYTEDGRIKYQERWDKGQLVEKYYYLYKR